MADSIAVTVDHLSKSFKLPHERQSSLKGALINFNKRGYEEQHVLKDINFKIKTGEFFGIVGRNGSGKSTLLKLLAGVYTPDQGSIAIEGRLTPFIELGVGFNPELTGRENVFLNGALLGFNRKDMQGMYDEIVAFAELERFMDQKLKNYSSGMQVRLAFSIAIKAQSDVLILDEVLAVGDAAFQRKCYEYFMSLKKDKCTVVLVTHDMSAVRQYCDRAVMLEKGSIVEEGTPEVVAQAYQRLFNEYGATNKVEDLSVNEGDRWGEGGLYAKSVGVKISEDKIAINVTYEATKDLEPPVYGFTLYDSRGDNIIEGNTKRLRYNTKKTTKGDMVTFNWAIPNILKDGSYSLSVACCDQSTTRFYDWLNGAATFKIFKDGETAAMVDPTLELQVDD